MTPREKSPDTTIATHFVDGAAIATELSWLHDVYTGLFHELAQQLSGEPNDIRISLAMTFFTTSCPEAARPADLDKYLGLT